MEFGFIRWIFMKRKLTLSVTATAYVTGHDQSNTSKMTGHGQSHASNMTCQEVVCDWLYTCKWLVRCWANHHLTGPFSVTKATLQSQMSIHPSVHQKSKPPTAWNHYPSSFFIILPHPSLSFIILHFATFKVFSLFNKWPAMTGHFTSMWSTWPVTFNIFTT